MNMASAKDASSIVITLAGRPSFDHSVGKHRYERANTDEIDANNQQKYWHAGPVTP